MQTKHDRNQQHDAMRRADRLASRTGRTYYVVWDDAIDMWAVAIEDELDGYFTGVQPIYISSL